MGVTNEFERDLINQAQLKHPGRVDLIVFQNVADAGDGSPGIQRAFRNYLHEGGIEKDLQLLGFGIKGTSVDINNAELQQLSNIGDSVISSNEWSQIANIGDSVTINVTQWGYVGALNQGLTVTSNVGFGQITPSGNIVMTDNNITFTSGLVDGVDVSAHVHSGAGQGGTVAHSSTSGRTVDSHHTRDHSLSGSTHTGDLAYVQIDSIVDTSGVGSANMISVATHVHTNADGSTKITHSNISGIGVSDHHSKYTDANARTATLSNTAFGSSWGSITTNAPTKQASYRALTEIRTGAYTGDGSTNKRITIGDGLAVKWVLITRYQTSDHNGEAIWFKFDVDTLYAHGFELDTCYIREDRIRWTSGDYFEVDDASADVHPNTNGQVYHYVVFCSYVN